VQPLAPDDSGIRQNGQLAARSHGKPESDVWSGTGELISVVRENEKTTAQRPTSLVWGVGFSQPRRDNSLIIGYSEVGWELLLGQLMKTSPSHALSAFMSRSRSEGYPTSKVNRSDEKSHPDCCRGRSRVRHLRSEPAWGRIRKSKRPAGRRPLGRALLSLQDLNGQPLDLPNYRGKVVLLDFWATWCTPCRGEIPHFVDFQDKYREQGLQVIGISMDDGPKPVREFYQQFKMNYPVALENEKVADAYGGVLGLPITFLISRDGHVAAKYVGEVQMPTLEQGIESLLRAK
jgi:thiol-disulfide isomerase/thioredoxin